MIEAEGNEVEKELLKEAFVVGQKAIDESCDFQTKFLETLTVVPQKIMYNKPSEDLIAYISKILTEEKLQALTGNSKIPFNELSAIYEKEVLEISKEKIADAAQEDFTETKVKMGVFNVIKYFLRHRTLDTGKRIDDRDQKEIRPIFCEVASLPRVHGSGLFRRGDTQVLTTVTL